MRISSLKYFYEVAELKSISKVSNNLHISQPALSHQLLTLEKYLGVKLFERSNRGVELTRKGKIVYEYSKQIIDMHDNLISELNETDKEKKEIKISILSIYSNCLIDSIAEDMKSIFKGINVSISNDLENKGKSLLLHNRADILIGKNRIDDVDLISERIGGDKLILVSGQNVPCNKIDNLSIALLEDSIGGNSELESKIGEENIFLKTDCFKVMNSYLRTLNTAAIVPNMAVKKELYENKLVRLCTDLYEVEYDLFITYRKDRSRKFKNKLKELKNNLKKVLNEENIDIAI